MRCIVLLKARCSALDGTPIQFSETERVSERVPPREASTPSRTSGLQSCAEVVRALWEAPGRFNAGAEEAIRSFSSCNLFLRSGRSFFRRLSAEPRRRHCRHPGFPGCPLPGATCVGRRARRRFFYGRPLLLPPFEGTRILAPSAAASRTLLCFCCAPKRLSAPRRALTTMGVNAVNRDPSITSSYHRSALADDWPVIGPTNGDNG